MKGSSTSRVSSARTITAAIAARIIGIAMSGPVQLIFVDTPGIFSPKRRLDRAMVRAAWTGADDADFLDLHVNKVPEFRNCRSLYRANNRGKGVSQMQQ